MSLDNEISETDAVAQIVGLLDLDDAPAQRKPRAEAAPENDESDDESALGNVDDESDEAPDEDLVSQEDEDENDPEVPAIEAPESWKAQKRALFESLPDEAKSYIAERDGEMKSAFNRQVTLLAEERKAVEAHVQQANQAKVQQENALQQLLVMTLPELKQLEQVNWQELATSDPARYVQLQQLRNDVVGRVQTVQNHLAQLQQQSQAEQGRLRQAHLAAQYPEIVKRVPEFADVQSARAQALVADINSTAAKFGFNPDEISGSIGDARIVHVLAELAKHEKAAEARKSAQGKKTAQAAPKVMSTTAAPVRDRSKGQKVKEQMDTLFRSNGRDSKTRLSARQQGELATSLIANLL